MDILLVFKNAFSNVKMTMIMINNFFPFIPILISIISFFIKKILFKQMKKKFVIFCNKKWYIKLLSTFGALWSWLWLQSKNRTVRCNWHKKILNKNKWRLLAWTYPVHDNEIRWQIYMRVIDSNSLADRSIKCIFICVHFMNRMIFQNRKTTTK